MELIRRNESSLHHVPNVVPLLCAIDIPVCLVSGIALLVMAGKTVAGHASSPAMWGITAGILGAGLLFSFFADHYYDWLCGYVYEPGKTRVSYSVLGSVASSNHKTVVDFLSVKQVREKRGKIIVTGIIEKQVPRKQAKRLARYVIPKGFTKEQRDVIVGSLRERKV